MSSFGSLIFSLSIVSISLMVNIVVPCTSLAAKKLLNQVVISASAKKRDRMMQLERLASAHSQLLTQLQQQLADNQRATDFLRGQVQENQYHLSQLLKLQKQIYQEINRVISAQGQGQCFLDDAALHSGAADYNEALAFGREKKQYAQTKNALQRFIKHYPDSIYQPNANYWLGQINYKQGKKHNAAYYFALVVKKYPQSSTAPDALLKIGLIMQEKGQKDKARAVYQQVNNLYSNTDVSKQAQKLLNKL